MSIRKLRAFTVPDSGRENWKRIHGYGKADVCVSRSQTSGSLRASVANMASQERREFDKYLKFLTFKVRGEERTHLLDVKDVRSLDCSGVMGNLTASMINGVVVSTLLPVYIHRPPRLWSSPVGGLY